MPAEEDEEESRWTEEKGSSAGSVYRGEGVPAAWDEWI